MRQLGRLEAGDVDLGSKRLLVDDDGFGAIPENDWVERMGLGPAVVLRTGSTRALANAAMAGAGIAILPSVFGRRLGLVGLAVKPPPPRQAWIVAHRDLRRVRALAAVHAWIVEVCARWFADTETPPAAAAHRRR